MSDMAQTSLLAYTEVLEKLGEKQLLVLNAIDKIEPCNNLMISQYLHLPINSITPRVNELRHKSLIYHDSTQPCPSTKRMTMFWRRVRK